MSKKVISSLLVLLLLATMCLGFATPAMAGGEQVTLTIWGDPDNQAILEDTFKTINAMFEEQNPDIKLDYQFSGTFEALNVAIQSDSLPDLFWVQGNKSTKMAEMARNGYLLNLDSYNMDQSRFIEECIDYASVDGSVYCSFPSFSDYVVFYYNKDIFAANGLEKPGTWDEFNAAVETLYAAGVTPIGFGGTGDFDRYWLMQIWAPALCNDTMLALSEGTEVDWAPMEYAFDTYRAYAEKGYLGKDFAGMDGASAQLAFTNGKAAMIPDGTWSNNIYQDLGFEIGRFAMPDAEGKRYSQSGMSNFNTYAVSSKCAYPDAAVRYLEFLNSLECQQVFEDDLGSIPVLKDITPKDEIVAEISDFDIVGRNIYHVLAGLAGGAGKPEDVFLGDVMPQLMMSEITGAEGVAKIQAEIEKAL